MHRRTFVKNSSLLALSIGVFGRIKFANGAFIGDTPTTTDVLGPFYRPGAPFRTNINPAGFNGTPLHISGVVYHPDGKAVFKNCLVEVWQCDNQGKYDTLSGDFIYRGAAKTGNDGSYHFITTHPAAYTIDANKTFYRPAHIHLRISGGEEYQDLITQVYFQGDPHLKTDSYSSSPSASNRILETSKNSENEDVVHFDIIMSKEFLLDDAVFKKLSGVYTSSKLLSEFEGLNDDGRIELYKNGNLLYLKISGQIEEALHYSGNNTFENGADLKIKFKLLQDGGVKITGNALSKGNWQSFECSKVLSY